MHGALGKLTTNPEPDNPFFDVDETTQTGQNVFVGATKQTKQNKTKMKKLTQKELVLLRTLFASSRITWRTQAAQSTCRSYREVMDQLIHESYDLENHFFANPNDNNK